MKIDKTLILKLEELARLKLSEAERSEIIGDLSKILTMVEKLKELDLSQVEPLLHVTDSINRTREDMVSDQLTREEALYNAPSPQGPYFTVPKVIDRNEE